MVWYTMVLDNPLDIPKKFCFHINAENSAFVGQNSRFDHVWYGMVYQPQDMPSNFCFHIQAENSVLLGQNSSFAKVWYGMVWFGLVCYAMVLGNP